MTIDEAITRLEVFVKDVSEAEPELLDDAIRLGIEALKVVQKSRTKYSRSAIYLLPGETGDSEKPKGMEGAFVPGYTPYIDKDKHEPETMSEMIMDKDF